MKILKSDRVLVVAEVAQAHDGSLGAAPAEIDAVARADAVKFQRHIAAAKSTPGEPWRVTFSWISRSLDEFKASSSVRRLAAWLADEPDLVEPWQ